MLRAVLFDLDGTLLDSAAEFTVALNRLRQEHNLPPLPDRQTRPLVSDGARVLVRFALGLEEEEQVEEQRRRFLEIYAQGLGQDCRLFPGVAGLLRKLERRGVPWGIVTNKMEHLTLPLLQRLQIPTQILVCPDHVRHSKPAPDPVLLACRKMQLPVEEVMYVGDHQRDIEAGRAAGTRTAVAAWGYIHPDEAPHEWGADYMLHDVAALDSLLQKLLDGE